MLTQPKDTDDFHDGVSFTIEALACVLGIDINSFSHDAATETMEGDVMAVLGNCLTARFGEDAWQKPREVPGGVMARDNPYLRVVDESE